MGREPWTTEELEAKKSGLHHCVLVVGFGKSNRGVNFWKVMNLWGTNWCDRGFARVVRRSSLPPGREPVLTRITFPKLHKEDIM